MQPRNILLVDKRFQFRFSFYVCSWIFGLSLIYPLIIYSLFEKFIRQANLDPTGVAMASIENTLTQVVYLLVALQVLFLICTFLISVYLSHRIAGPVYKLRQFFDYAKNGDFKRELYFRKSDHFKELAKSYNEMMAGVRAEIGRNNDKLKRSIDHLETAVEKLPEGHKDEVRSALDSLREVHELNSL